MDKADPRAKLEPFQALIGEWTIEMTHPMVEDTVVRGRATYDPPFFRWGSPLPPKHVASQWNLAHLTKIYSPSCREGFFSEFRIHTPA
jgi:hypothetical protein